MTRRGVALLEVLAGLVIMGLLMTVAANLTKVLLDTAGQAAAFRASAARRGRAVAWLKAAFGSSEVGTNRGAGFDGTDSSLVFTTRLQQADGRFVLRTVDLVRASGRVIAALGGTDTIRLAASPSGARFAYLASYGTRSEWLAGWHSPATAPLAVRIVLQHGQVGTAASADTLVFLIGPRG